LASVAAAPESASHVTPSVGVALRLLYGQPAFAIPAGGWCGRVLAVKTRTALAATFGNMARRERTQPAGGVPAHRLDADTSVNRIGYCAMQLAGPGVWGRPRTRTLRAMG
jgi:hypothetical protein